MWTTMTSRRPKGSNCSRWGREPRSFWTATSQDQSPTKPEAPSTTGTACPTMDKVIKGRLPAATKLRDRQLDKQQVLMLDAVGPVTYILESAVKGELTQKAAIGAAQTALKLLGNASGNANRERRKSALQSQPPPG